MFKKKVKKQQVPDELPPIPQQPQIPPLPVQNQPIMPRQTEFIPEKPVMQMSEEEYSIQEHLDILEGSIMRALTEVRYLRTQA